MSSQEKILTLAEIKDKYPVRKEVFTAEDKKVIEAWVVRDADHVIVYVAPKSIRFISDSDENPPQQ